MEEQLAQQVEPPGAPNLDDKKYICYSGQVCRQCMIEAPGCERCVCVRVAVPHPLSSVVSSCEGARVKWTPLIHHLWELCVCG